MAEVRKDENGTPVAFAADDLSRLAEATTKLFAEQASAMAMMTAYSMSVSAQMTAMVLNSMRGPASFDGAGDATVGTVDASAAPDAEKPSAQVVELRPRARQASAKVKSARVKAPVATDNAVGDDLKKISGIGPRLEQVLNERGIRRYADLASMTKPALKKLDSELGLEGRTERDGWVSQAKALSGGEG